MDDCGSILAALGPIPGRPQSLPAGLRGAPLSATMGGGQEVDVETVRELAARWLATADRVGWGVEGPAHAEVVRANVQRLARIEPEATSIDLPDDRPLGTRPVDALSEAAELLGEAAAATGVRRGELFERHPGLAGHRRRLSERVAGDVQRRHVAGSSTAAHQPSCSGQTGTMSAVPRTSTRSSAGRAGRSRTFPTGPRSLWA